MIGCGAVLGANARYWVANYAAQRLGLAFPYGTLLINLSGSFLLAFVLVVISNRLVADPGLRLLIGTGFFGAYTTFSTFSYETLSLLEQGDTWLAVTNAAAGLFGALLAAHLGIVLARLLG